MLKRRRSSRALDDETGREAAGLSFRRVENTPGLVGYRLCLTSETGAVIASYDMDRGDMHDMRLAITNVLRVKAPKGSRENPIDVRFDDEGKPHHS